MSTYKGFIAKVDRIIEIEGANTVQLAIVLGTQLVVSKDTNVGDVGIFFPADTKLSHEYCHENSLYRNSELNKDKDHTGYFDINCRVRAQPFLKQKSEGYFAPVESLSFIGDTSHLKVGDQLDELNGIKLCEKYISPETRMKMNSNQQKKKCVDVPLFHKHVDTEQLKYFVNRIQPGSVLYFHAKVHGTSARMSYTKIVRTPKTFFEKLKHKLGLFESEYWDYVNGTRNVVLYDTEMNRNKEGFHGSEQYRFDVLDTVKPYLEKGMTIYGEIAGYVNGSPIMGHHNLKKLKNKQFTKKYGEDIVYKYGCLPHEYRFHIYRISYTNEDGHELDFPQKVMEKWCLDRDLLTTVEVHPSFIYDGDKDKLLELVEQLTERDELLTEDYIDKSHISEGIILRVEHDTKVPVFYKNKSYAFKVLEGIAKENGEEDVEESS